MSFYRRYQPQMIVTLAFVLLLGVFLLSAPQTFGSIMIYRSFLTTIPPVTLLALGLTFLVIMGGMDLSFPSLSALSAFCFAWLTTKGLNPWIGVGLGLLVGTAAGLLNGLIITTFDMPPMIATIGTQFAWRGFLLLVSGGVAIPLATYSQTSVFQFFVGRVGGFSLQGLWVLILTLLAALLLNRHPFGEAVLFLGDNPSAAKMMGLNIRKIRILTYGLMGLFAGFSGLFSTLELANWWPTQGEGAMLLAFAAVFVGGTSAKGGKGTIYGSFVGSLMIGIIEAGIVAAGLTGFWTRLIHGVVILLSVAAYSLMSWRKDREEG